MASPQAPYQVAADASAAYAKGYSDMLGHMAGEEAANQQSFLELIGAPAEQIAQYNESAQFPADVLYGAYGDVPGTALSQQGAAFGDAAGNLPGIFGNQLAFNQNVHSQEMAHQNAMAQLQMNHARSMAAADAGSSGGTASGLTPYQEASLAMRALEFQTDQDRYARQDELDWRKFEADLEQEEFERQQRENTAAFDSLLYQGIFMLANGEDPFKDKKFMAALTQASGMGSSSAANAFADAATGAAKDAADRKADALARRAGKRQDIRALIASEFNRFEGNNKKAAIGAIMGAIETQFPKFAGWKRDRVRNMVRQHVNSQWATRDRPGRSGGGPPDVSGRISSAFNDFVQGLEAPEVNQNFLRRYRNVAGYRQAMSNRAVNTIMGSIRDSMPRNQFRKQRPMILKMVRNYVRRNRSHFEVRRRPSPNTSGGGAGLGR